MPLALARLVTDPHAFLKGWPDSPQVYEPDGADFPGLLSLADTAAIATDPDLRPGEVGMVHVGTITGQIPDAEHPASTLVLNGLHRTWPPLTTLCSRLESELGHPLTANAYRTPPSSQGYGPHWDTHHVLLAQVDGAKTWRLSNPVFTDPLEQHRWTAIGFTDEQRQQAIHHPDLTVELLAGQVLFIPRGWVHWGSTDHRPSLHITLGVQVLTWHWVMEQLLRRGAEDGALRGALPPGLTIGLWPTLAENAGQRMTDWLAGLDPQNEAVALRSASFRAYGSR